MLINRFHVLARLANAAHSAWHDPDMGNKAKRDRLNTLGWFCKFLEFDAIRRACWVLKDCVGRDDENTVRNVNRALQYLEADADTNMPAPLLSRIDEAVEVALHDQTVIGLVGLLQGVHYVGKTEEGRAVLKGGASRVIEEFVDSASIKDQESVGWAYNFATHGRTPDGHRIETIEADTETGARTVAWVLFRLREVRA